MDHGLAVWGAVTGTIGTLTGVGNLLRTSVRDRRDAKRELAVSHGWQYAYSEGELVDVWVNVTVFNTGRRPLHVEYIGFETIVAGERRLADEAGIELPPENNVWVNRRFEIALNGETIEVAPDGPSVKIWTRLLPILRHGIDPTTTPIRGYAVTWPETYWWEPEPVPFLPRPTQQHRTMEEVGEAVAHLFLAELGEEELEPVADAPGEVVGLQRLILDGDTQRTSELFNEDPPTQSP